MVLAAGDQRREAADAEFLCGEEIAEGFVLGLGCGKRGAELRAVETGFLGHRRDFIGRRHVAVLGVEGLLNARHERQSQVRHAGAAR